MARDSINQTIDFLKQIYETNLKTLENQRVLVNFTKILRTCVKLIIFNYTFCVSSFYLSPVIIYSVTGSADPIMPLFLPGTSPDSMVGFTISTIYHLFAIFCAGAVYIFFDVLFAVQVLHVILMSNILRNKICAINEMVTAKNPSHPEIIVNFRNVLIIHNEILMWVEMENRERRKNGERTGVLYQYNILSLQ